MQSRLPDGLSNLALAGLGGAPGPGSSALQRFDIARVDANQSRRWVISCILCGQPQAGKAGASMKRILVPFDGSKAAESALGVAVDLALQHGASVKLLHVLLHEAEADQLLGLPGIADTPDEVVEELRRLTQTPEPARSIEQEMANPGAPIRPAPTVLLRLLGSHVLDWAKSRAAERGIEAEELDLVDGPAAETIVSAAGDMNADAIVMGTRGLRPIDAITVGSVSQEVCRTAACTCIMVH